MGFWTSLLKGAGTATKATARSMGSAVIHPSQTLRGAGSAMKTVAVGGAVGYVGWEKLTTDKSVARIVSDAVIGEEATNSLVGTADEVKELKDKAGAAVDSVNSAASGISSQMNGISGFFRNLSNGNGMNMFGNFFGNIAKGNVSGLSIVGLIAAAFLAFGRFGWLGKIAGAMLGMMLIGNNSQAVRAQVNTLAETQETAQMEQRTSGGMRR